MSRCLVTVFLDHSTVAKLDAEATSRGVSRSSLIRDAIVARETSPGDLTPALHRADPPPPRTDPWVEPTLAWAASTTTAITLADVFRRGLAKERWSRADELRVADILKSDGYRHRRVMRGGHRSWIWERRASCVHRKAFPKGWGRASDAERRARWPDYCAPCAKCAAAIEGSDGALHFIASP